MIDVAEWNWIVDTDTMTCRNAENKVIIKIQKNGKNLNGIIKDMPIDLFNEIAKYKDGEMIIQKIINMAEEEFIKATM